MIIEDIFNDVIFPNLKTYVESNSSYSPKLVKVVIQDSKVFPIVSVKLLPIENKYNNLSYGEETIKFGIEINVYSQEKIIGNNKISKKTICDEVLSKIITYFRNNYHVSLKIEYDLANIDSNVHRNYLRVLGILDTKYGSNNYVIYPG